MSDSGVTPVEVSAAALDVEEAGSGVLILKKGLLIDREERTCCLKSTFFSATGIAIASSSGLLQYHIV